MTVTDSRIAWYISYSGSDNSFNNLSDSVIDSIINKNSYLQIAESIDQELSSLETDDDSFADDLESLSEAIDEFNNESSTEDDSENSGDSNDPDDFQESDNEIVIVDANESEFVLNTAAELNVLGLAGDINLNNENSETDSISPPTITPSASPSLIEAVEQDVSELIDDNSVAALDVESIVAATVEEIAIDIAIQNMEAIVTMNDDDTVINIDDIANKVTDGIIKGADLASGNQDPLLSTNEPNEETEIAIIDTDEQEQIASYTKEEIRELVRSIALSILHDDESQIIEFTPVNMEKPHLVRVLDQHNEQNYYVFDLRSTITGMEEAKLLDKQINSGSFRISKLAVADQHHGGVNIAGLLGEVNDRRKEKQEERAEHKERLYENARVAARSRLSQL